MFSFLRKHTSHGRNLFNSDLATILCFNSIRFISCSSTNQNSFTISYLVNKCGFSQEKATSASHKISFEDSTKPDSVLAVLESNGFPNTHISNTIQKLPSLLLCNANKTLKPKFDFFNSMGLSGLDLAKAISAHPFVLQASLEKTIIPSFDFLKTIVQTENEVITMLKRAMAALIRDPQKYLSPNVALLRDYGVPDSNIVYLLVSRPRVLLETAHRFKELVKQVKEMEFDPSQCMFVMAINALASMKKSTLEAKLDIYRSYGWSEDEIQCAFRKQPYCMMLSGKKIMGTTDYLVNKMGYDPSLLAKHPGILLFSLERRIIPRCSVIQVLFAKGLLEKYSSLYNLLNVNEKKFLNFMAKFEEKVPELLNAYQGKGR